MKCYDCDLTGKDDSVAIGICQRCSLVVCPDHGHVTQTAVHRPNGMGRSTSARPARRVVCRTCHSAELAA